MKNHHLLPLLILLALAPPSALPGAVPSEPPVKPNLIYILLDDAGYGDFGCYGQKTLRTPHVDRLASEGMKFTRHYSGAAVCAPSRFGLLTGIDPRSCSPAQHMRATLSAMPPREGTQPPT